MGVLRGTRVVALAMLAGSAAAWHVGGGAAFAPLSSGPGTSACLRRGGDNARLCARSATRGGAPLETRMGAPLDSWEAGVSLGARPVAPDPFHSVSGDLQLIKAKIKRMADSALKSNKAALQGAAEMGGMGRNWKGFFERPEKSWRPAVVVLLAEAMGSPEVAARSEGARAPGRDEVLAIAEIVELMQLATQIHDTILEDDDRLDKGNEAHKLYGSVSAGNKVSVLAGDFLLSRASVLSASLRNLAVVESVASALQSLMEGQVQLAMPVLDAPSLNLYIKNAQYRGGMLLSRGCESVALTAGHAQDSEVTAVAREFGLNLGMTYQITKDLQVTEANYAKLLNKVHKESSSPNGVCYLPRQLDAPLQAAGPLLYAATLFPELQDVAQRGFTSFAEVLHAKSLIDRCDAVHGMRRLAQYHARLALDALESLPESEARQSLALMVHFARESAQPRLSRANYSPEGQFRSKSALASSAALAASAHKAEVAARKDLYRTLNGGGGDSFGALRDTVVSGLLGVKARANTDIARLQRAAVREAVLLYGKNVPVGTVMGHINLQCAFHVTAETTEQMLVEEIQWQLKLGIETHEDIVKAADAGRDLLPPAW
eukprot:CAMPEP_0180163936 /NCGR_PEP_ID=MMETSP0986-20121125/30086_1 /TAXON_ID=697907 /ORGANISM="non described non described, Strain CCMP2293" /LENGTH=602 /DNA_ID=CAMNT_0022114647 /DNA_START=15 /DNA_END=1820 /DNA_ORIENTATION=+